MLLKWSVFALSLFSTSVLLLCVLCVEQPVFVSSTHSFFRTAPERQRTPSRLFNRPCHGPSPTPSYGFLPPWTRWDTGQVWTSCHRGELWLGSFIWLSLISGDAHLSLLGQPLHYNPSIRPPLLHAAHMMTKHQVTNTHTHRQTQWNTRRCICEWLSCPDCDLCAGCTRCLARWSREEGKQKVAVFRPQCRWNKWFLSRTDIWADGSVLPRVVSLCHWFWSE